MSVKNKDNKAKSSQANGVLDALYATDGPFAFLNRSIPTWSGQKAVALSMMLVAALALVISVICNLTCHKPETSDAPHVTYNSVSYSDTVTNSDTGVGITYTAGDSSSKGTSKGKAKG